MFHMLPDEANNTHTHTHARAHMHNGSVNAFVLSLLFPVSLQTHRADFGSQPIKWWMTLHNILPCLLSGSKSCMSAFRWQKLVMATGLLKHFIHVPAWAGEMEKVANSRQILWAFMSALKCGSRKWFCLREMHSATTCLGGNTDSPGLCNEQS